MKSLYFLEVIMITNETAIRGLQVINILLVEKLPTKFVYTLIKNKQLLEPVLKAYNDTIESDKDADFAALKEQWDIASQKYAFIDNNGNTSMKSDGSMVIEPSKINDFNNECMAILNSNTVWQEALARRTKLVVELQKSDSKFVPVTISIDSFPDTIQGEFMEVLSFIVE
jgi:hypothetical protein